MKQEDLIYVEKHFETEKYITTTSMLVDDEGKVYYKWVVTEPTEDEENIADLLIHRKLFKKLH